MSRNLVSCFLPVFNAKPYLARWWEMNGPELVGSNATLVVVDNGSTDGTLEQVRGLNYPRVRVIQHGENLGLEQSFRSAKALIDSKYSFFLPADDWLAPGYLREAITVMEEDPDVGVVYGDSYMVDLGSDKATKRVSPWRTPGARRESACLPLFFNNFIPDISLYRSDLLRGGASWGWFPPGLQSAIVACSKVYYTGEDQCFSGKSAGQVSKEWARSGRYFSFLSSTYAEARQFCCADISEEILWYLAFDHFNTNRPLLKSIESLRVGGMYSRSAVELAGAYVLAKVGLVLVDELLIDPATKKFRNEGRLGSFADLRGIIRSLDGRALSNFREGLEVRGAGGILL